MAGRYKIYFIRVKIGIPGFSKSLIKNLHSKFWN